MSPAPLINLLVLLALLAVTGLAVAAEFAFVRVRRTRLDELLAQGAAGSRAARHVLDHLDRYIAATQLAITISGIGLGWVGEPALSALFEPIIAAPLQALPEDARRAMAAAVSLTLVTFITVVLGEIVPKSLAIQNAEAAAMLLGGPVTVLGAVFRPAVWLLNSSSTLVLRLLGVRGMGPGEGAYSVQELKLLVAASGQSGVIEDSERDMIHAVFDFGDLTARELMVPRTELLAVDADAPIDELIQLAIRQPRSQYPIFEGDLDHILGVAHLKDLVRVQHDQRRAATIRGLLREALFVPDTTRLDNLLKQFRAKRQHLAIVLDEYGGTAGLVTLEDLVEQIVGEVQDPFDRAAPDVQRLPDGSALLDGLALIETVNEQLGLKLQDDYYDTIAGYVLGRLGRMARVGDHLDVDSARLTVEAMDGLRIARLRLIPQRPAPGGPSA